MQLHKVDECGTCNRNIKETVQVDAKLTEVLSFCPILSGCSGGRVVSTSASHQCGPGSIPSWGSDPSAVSEKGFVPV